jgi:ADP-ribose pyrophosphatase YjhB (NUDIX family)
MRIPVRDHRQENYTSQLYLIADELRAAVNYELMHDKDPYTIECLNKVLELSARLISITDKKPVEDVLTIYRDNMDHISPVIGSEAAVFRGNKLLLIRRHDNGLWAIPGGKSDVGETLAGTATRELKEETGLTGKIIRLLGIFDSRLWNTRDKQHIYHAVFEVGADGTPEKTREALDCGFFREDELPELSPGHDMRVPFLFKLIKGEVEVPFLDS